MSIGFKELLKKENPSRKIFFSIFINTDLQSFKIEAMSSYPLINFHFEVDWGGSDLSFSQVSGLTAEHELLEIKYRGGASLEYSTIKVPTFRKFSNIILKRGTYQGNNEFFDWFNTAQFSGGAKRDIAINLLNEEHKTIIVWKIRNTWPIVLKFAELNAMKSEILIERLEIAHEGFTVETI